MAKAKIEHVLVPKHSKLSEKDKRALLEKYHISLKELPKILIKDPAIAHLDLKAEDIVKIERTSPTAGKTVFYRAVIAETKKPAVTAPKEKEVEEKLPEEKAKEELEEELPE